MTSQALPSQVQPPVRPQAAETLADAHLFLSSLKSSIQLSDKPELYDEFLDAMKAFQGGEMNTIETAVRVVEVIWGCTASSTATGLLLDADRDADVDASGKLKELVEGFGVFLPKEFGLTWRKRRRKKMWRDSELEEEREVDEVVVRLPGGAVLIGAEDESLESADENESKGTSTSSRIRGRVKWETKSSDDVDETKEEEDELAQNSYAWLWLGLGEPLSKGKSKSESKSSGSSPTPKKKTRLPRKPSISLIKKIRDQCTTEVYIHVVDLMIRWNQSINDVSPSPDPRCLSFLFLSTILNIFDDTSIWALFIADRYDRKRYCLSWE
jgi:hypothetical protein